MGGHAQNKLILAAVGDESQWITSTGLYNFRRVVNAYQFSRHEYTEDRVDSADYTTH